MGTATGGHGRLREATGGHGRQWEATGSRGRPREGTGGNGRPREAARATGGHGRPRAVTGGYGRAREATGRSRSSGSSLTCPSRGPPWGARPLFDAVSLKDLSRFHFHSLCFCCPLVFQHCSKQLLPSCCPCTSSLALSSLPVP